MAEALSFSLLLAALFAVEISSNALGLHLKAIFFHGSDGMNFTNLRYFVRAYETRSFTETGKEFFVTQVAVTQQIKLVESELDTKLFFRRKNKIFPTKEGDFFYREAKDILERYDNAFQMIKLHGAEGVMKKSG